MLDDVFDRVLRAAQAGAAWAFERLWEDLGPLVAGYLRLQGAQEPDDLASEVFIGVFRGIGGFDGDERAFRSWVLTIAHRRLIDERRRRGRRVDSTPVGLDLQVGSVGDAAEDALARIEDEQVRALLERLPDAQRDVLLLRILGDLTVAEVADVLGRTQGGVKALQRRGLARLRKIISREGVPL